MIPPITELQDSRLDPFRRTRDRDLRANDGRFVVESPRVVSRFIDAVRTGRFAIDRILVAPEHAERFAVKTEMLDAEVLVAADAGIQPQTREAVKRCAELRQPVLFAISKADVLGSDLAAAETHAADRPNERAR